MTIKSKSGYDFKKAKEEYRAFCETESNDLPVFAQPWFLDAACDEIDDWQVIIHKEGNKIDAAFPFEYIKTNKGWYQIRNPFQAKRLGIWLECSIVRNNFEQEVFENSVTKYVIDNLPYYDVFHIEFDARYTNWREFFNNGFTQETRYSYILPVFSSREEYLSLFSKKRNKEIKKKGETTKIIKKPNIDIYWSFLVESYKLRNRDLSYGENKFKRIIEAVLKNRSGDIYFAINEDNKIVGERIYFRDSKKTYQMFGSFDPREKLSAQPLINYQAILDSASNKLIFDFEGSMEPGVADYNRQFGAIQEPYFVINKYSEKYQLANSLRESMTLLKKRIIKPFCNK